MLSKEILKSGADAAFVASFSVRYVRSHLFVAEALSEAETSCLKSNTVLQFLRGNRAGGHLYPKFSSEYFSISTSAMSLSVDFFVNVDTQSVTDASLTPIYQNELDLKFTLRNMKTRVGKGNIY